MKNLKLFSWSSTFRFENRAKSESKKEIGTKAQVYILGAKQQKNRQEIIERTALDWQQDELKNSKKEVLHFIGHYGPVWILLEAEKKKLSSANALVTDSHYSQMRDYFGTLVSSFKNLGVKKVYFNFVNLEDWLFESLLLGLDLASYNFKAMSSTNPFHDLPQVIFPQLNQRMKKTFDLAQLKARAVNRARHLVNLPPNECNPETMEKMARGILPKNLRMEVWDHKRLEKEKMHLHLSVGQGSVHPPRMIRLSYRPKGSSTKGIKNHSSKRALMAQAPVAFVGKGITFDTGGLDLKPSAAMRLMKKDMGGSASVLALALFAAEAQVQKPCDFYLALAENSVDQNSFRPSDVYLSRAGYKVEIDNTDAEGRLVLADVLDVAATQKGKDEPAVIIDVATLTGACRVALGTEVAGLFSNDDRLARELTNCGKYTGDFCWQMPLVERYFSSYNTVFADFKNSGDGMGGAITAGVFLQKFVRGKKWAHLDAYCWNDKPNGSLSFAGGSGQTVQMLIQFLMS